MPNFTEGEWSYHPTRYGLSDDINYEIESSNGDSVCGEWRIYSEPDARLMANAKRMYEVLNKLSESSKWNNFSADIFSEIKDILSDIEKE